jgi:hypothetical protein
MSDYSDGFWRTMEAWDRIELRRVQRQTVQRETIARIRASLDQESQMPMAEPLTPPSSDTTPSTPVQMPEPFTMSATEHMRGVRARIKAMLP